MFAGKINKKERGEDMMKRDICDTKKPLCFGNFLEEPDVYGDYPPWLCKNCLWRKECEKKTFIEEIPE